MKTLSHFAVHGTLPRRVMNIALPLLMLCFWAQNTQAQTVPESAQPATEEATPDVASPELTAPPKGEVAPERATDTPPDAQPAPRQRSRATEDQATPETPDRATPELKK